MSIRKLHSNIVCDVTSGFPTPLWAEFAFSRETKTLNNSNAKIESDDIY